MADPTIKTHATSAGHAFREFIQSARLAIVHDGVESVLQTVRDIQVFYGDDDLAAWTMAEAAIHATAQQLAIASLVFCTAVGARGVA